MKELYAILAPVWQSTFERASDIVSWCLFLLILRRQYHSKVRYLPLFSSFLLITGGIIQLAADVISGNNFVLYVLIHTLWNYIMLAVLFNGRREQKILHAILYGFAWPQSVFLSNVFFVVFQYIGISIPMRLLALIVYASFLHWTIKLAPYTDLPLPMEYFFSCILVCLINLFICYSAPVSSIDNMEGKYLMFMAACAGGTFLIEAIVLRMVHLLMSENEKNLTQIIWKNQREESAVLVNRTITFEEEYRKLQHEINHAASLASMLIQNREYEEAQNILSELRENVEAYRHSGTKSTVVDTVLDEYRSTAKAMNVPMDVDIHLSEVIPVSPLDLCSMLSNMLSNALEASVNCVDSYVWIEIRPVKRYLMIKVRNRVQTDILEDNPNLITTKHNSAIHGKGTRIMKQICKKYNGMLNFEVKDLVFCAEALLLLDEKTK